MGGRKADPTRARRGTGHRPVNQLPALAPGGAVTEWSRPDDAPWLPAAAQPMFDQACRELAGRGLRESDYEALAMMATSAWAHTEARKQLAAQGILVRRGQTAQVNPLVKVVRDEAATYMRIADQYGLTLASRLRLGLMQLQGESMLRALNEDLDREPEG